MYYFPPYTYVVQIPRLIYIYKYTDIYECV